MNYLWGLMIAAGIAYASFHGTLPGVTQAALDSSKDAITLCITMLGVMSLWNGLMRIAERAGIIRHAVLFLKPLLFFLFPDIPKNHPAFQYIAENFIANIFGLGWAATPAGLKAMTELKNLETERGNSDSQIASNEMCTFLILNISSLQLIPVNILAYRSQFGSAQPSHIIGPSIIATCVSTIAAVLFSFLFNHCTKK